MSPLAVHSMAEKISAVSAMEIRTIAQRRKIDHWQPRSPERSAAFFIRFAPKFPVVSGLLAGMMSEFL